MAKKSKALNFSLECPIPLRRYQRVVMGHGSGGQMMNELLEHLILPAFGTQNTVLTDGAVLDHFPSQKSKQKLVMTTDSFVINPVEFPGGNIGSLSVHGTVNDLAMMGATPQYLSVGLILEEGLEMDVLVKVIRSLGAAAKEAGVQVVAGDTKVVQKGSGDGVFINTTGIGSVPSDRVLSPTKVEEGDVVLINGSLGDHGMAIMSVREGLEFETVIESDSANLHPLTASLFEAEIEVKVMRDLTRGGLAAATNEIASAAKMGIVVQEEAVPVNPQVHGACEMLGMDVFSVANEGKMMAVVPKKDAEKALKVMKKHSLGKNASVIGEVTSDHPGFVVGMTSIGSERVIDTPPGELLPRIC